MIKKDKQQQQQEIIHKNYTPMWQNIFRGITDNQDIDVLNILKKVPVFCQLTKKELKKVSLIIYERTYSTGEFLFKESNPGSAMFIIKNGTVSVESPVSNGKKECYATLISGDFIGESSLIEDSERTANARCTTKTTAIIIFRHDLFDLISREPVLGTKILKDLASMINRRLKESNDELLRYKALAEDKNEQQ